MGKGRDKYAHRECKGPGKESRNDEGQKSPEPAVAPEIPGNISCEEIAASRGDAVTVPKEEYEALKKKADDAGKHYDSLLRLQAELDNFRKRVVKEKEEFCRYAQEGLIFELLDFLDDFERALQSAGRSEDFRGLFNGVEMMYRRLDGVLRKKGLTRMESVGSIFNPTLHEAVAEEVLGDLPEHTVVEELQKGYLLHGRVLRPARVKVSKKPETQPVPEGQPPGGPQEKKQESDQ